ncbi:hypothetical protein MY3296_003583 [Beauveria thailandica]
MVLDLPISPIKIKLVNRGYYLNLEG